MRDTITLEEFLVLLESSKKGASNAERFTAAWPDIDIMLCKTIMNRVKETASQGFTPPQRLAMSVRESIAKGEPVGLPELLVMSEYITRAPEAISLSDLIQDAVGKAAGLKNEPEESKADSERIVNLLRNIKNK